MRYKVMVWQSVADYQWRWRLTSAHNGQVLATSQPYAKKANATAAARKVVKSAGWELEVLTEPT